MIQITDCDPHNISIQNHRKKSYVPPKSLMHQDNARSKGTAAPEFRDLSVWVFYATERYSSDSVAEISNPPTRIGQV